MGSVKRDGLEAVRVQDGGRYRRSQKWETQLSS